MSVLRAAAPKRDALLEVVRVYEPGDDTEDRLRRALTALERSGNGVSAWQQLVIGLGEALGRGVISAKRSEELRQHVAVLEGRMGLRTMRYPVEPIDVWDALEQLLEIAAPVLRRAPRGGRDRLRVGDHVQVVLDGQSRDGVVLRVGSLAHVAFLQEREYGRYLVQELERT